MRDFQWKLEKTACFDTISLRFGVWQLLDMLQVDINNYSPKFHIPYILLYLQ